MLDATNVDECLWARAMSRADVKKKTPTKTKKQHRGSIATNPSHEPYCSDSLRPLALGEGDSGELRPTISPTMSPAATSSRPHLRPTVGDCRASGAARIAGPRRGQIGVARLLAAALPALHALHELALPGDADRLLRPGLVIAMVGSDLECGCELAPAVL